MTAAQRMALTFGLFFAAHLFASPVVASYAPAPPRRQMLPQNGPATVQRATVNAALDELPYVPGRLLIKFKSSVTACIDCLVGQRLPLAPALGSALLDDLNRLHGLRSVHPLRRSDIGVRSLSARRQRQKARQRQLADAVAARTGRAVPLKKFPDLTSTYVFELSPWLDMEEVARQYARDPTVAYAEPDRKVRVQLTPNDHYFSTAGSWGQPFDDLWGAKKISAPAAWEVTTGENVVVAVSDTGVDTAHPDITASMWTNPGEIAGNGIDDDGNGYVDDVNGWNFVADTNNVFDDFGHGTHVAGTIAATGQNGIGIIGVAFGSKIMAVKGLDSGGGGSIEDLANTILYATDNGANVINASWGGVGTSQTLDDAIATAAAASVVFVAAAGNSNVDVNAAPPWGPFTPADNRHAITVAAVDHLDQKAFFSNYGQKIDVAAPGGGDDGTGFDPFRSVLSLLSRGAVPDMTGNGKLIVGSNYVRQAGTSMAAPHVSGAAALVLAAHPTYSPAQVRQALRAGADDIEQAGYDFYAGYGRINAARAVALSAVGAEITSPSSGMVANGTSIPISGTASGGEFASYTLEYGPGQFPTSWTVFAGPITTPVDNDDLGTWDISDVPDGQYTIRLRVLNTADSSFEDRVGVTLDHVQITDPEAAAVLRANGPVEIRGTAAGGGFQGFVVAWRVTTPDYVTGSWRSDGISVAGGGASPVTDGQLATFDTGVLAGNTDIDFQVVVTQAGGGQASKEVHHVIIDPTLRAGWPQKIAGLPTTGLRLMNNVTLADVDGDGTKEILTAFGDMAYVFRHDGTLLPGWPQQMVSPTNPTWQVFSHNSVIAADLDGDGQLEVIAAAEWESDPDSYAGGAGAVYVWHADGTPMAGWPKYLGESTYGTNRPTELAVSDVDGDGHPDLIGVVGDSVVVVDRNGEALPGWPQQWGYYGCYSGCPDSVVAVADLDGDGKSEIAMVTGGASSRQRLLLYSASGRLKSGFPRSLGRTYGFGAMLTTYPFEQHIGHYVNAPVMADLDGDGQLEIAALTDKMAVRAYRANGKRVSLNPRPQGLANRQCLNWNGRGIAKLTPILDPLTAGDLNGDGRAELLLGGHTKAWGKVRYNGRNISVSWCPSLIASTDYINVLHAGKISPPGNWPVGISYPGAQSSYGPGSMAVGDIDGDLLPEVVSASGICGRHDGSFSLDNYRTEYRCFTIYAYDRFGNLLPGFPKATAGPGTTNSMTPGIGDLAGDGLKEIVWIDWYGNVMVWDVPGTPAPEALQWPMARHDAAHTGALTVLH
jgi:subtilisin family serine protease